MIRPARLHGAVARWPNCCRIAGAGMRRLDGAATPDQGRRLPKRPGNLKRSALIPGTAVRAELSPTLGQRRWVGRATPGGSDSQVCHSQTVPGQTQIVLLVSPLNFRGNTRGGGEERRSEREFRTIPSSVRQSHATGKGVDRPTRSKKKRIHRNKRTSPIITTFEVAS